MTSNKLYRLVISLIYFIFAYELIYSNQYLLHWLMVICPPVYQLIFNVIEWTTHIQHIKTVTVETALFPTLKSLNSIHNKIL